MKHTILKLTKKIIILIAITFLLIQNVCYGVIDPDREALITSECTALAGTAIKTGYTLSDTAALANGYNLKPSQLAGTTGEEYNRIWLCCATYVSAIYKKVLNIEVPISTRNGTDAFATKSKINPAFDEVKGINSSNYKTEMEVGDLVLWGTASNYPNCYRHIGIYIGAGQVSHCNQRAGEQFGGVKIESMWFESETLIIRLKDDISDQIPVLEDEIGYRATQAIKNFLYQNVSFNRQVDYQIDKTKTYSYQGIAKLESQKAVEQKSLISQAWESISSFFGNIVQFLANVVKASIVGLATVVQIAITEWVDVTTGNTSIPNSAIGGSTAVEMKDYTSNNNNVLRTKLANAISVEKIVYNLVPLLDINIFNGNVAAGQTVSESSVICAIRNVVASLYFTIRNVTLIGLLLVLIYLGIRRVLEQTAKGKAEFMKKLRYWFIAFAITFGLHYFLIAVIKTNEITVGLLSSVGQNVASTLTGGTYFDLSLAMRDLAYDMSFLKGMVSAVIYLIMIYYIIKFLIIYLKRLFVTIILILLGPLMALKYAYDQITLKNSKSLLNWAKEVIFSVGSQTIHALVYTIFIAMTFELITTADTGKIIVCLLSIAFIKSMPMFERKLRELLRLSGDGTASSLMGDIDKESIKDFFGVFIFAKFYNLLPKGMKEQAKKEYNLRTSKITNWVNEYSKSEYIKYRKRTDYEDLYREAYNKNAKGEPYKVSSELDKKLNNEIDAKLELEYYEMLENRRKKNKLGKQLLGLPLGTAIVISKDKLYDLVGYGMILTGFKTMGLLAWGGSIKGYKTIKGHNYKLDSKNYGKVETWANEDLLKYISQLDIKGMTRDEIAYRVRIAALHEARKNEIELEEEIKIEKDKVQEKVSQNQLQIAQGVMKKELTEAVYEEMKNIDRQDIKQTVKEYMKEKNKESINLKDCFEIAKRFNVKVCGEIVEGENVQIDAFQNNLQKITIAKFIKEVTLQEGVEREIKLDEKILSSVQEKAEEKINNGASEEQLKGLELVYKCLEDKKNELLNNQKSNVYNNLNKEEKELVQKELSNILSEETDLLNNIVEKMPIKEIINNIKKATELQGSIDKKPYKNNYEGIISKIKNLRRIDEAYRRYSNEPIYENPEELVKKILQDKKVEK